MQVKRLTRTGKFTKFCEAGLSIFNILLNRVYLTIK